MNNEKATPTLSARLIVATRERDEARAELEEEEARCERFAITIGELSLHVMMLVDACQRVPGTLRQSVELLADQLDEGDGEAEDVLGMADKIDKALTSPDLAPWRERERARDAVIAAARRYFDTPNDQNGDFDAIEVAMTALEAAEKAVGK